MKLWHSLKLKFEYVTFQNILDCILIITLQQQQCNTPKNHNVKFYKSVGVTFRNLAHNNTITSLKSDQNARKLKLQQCVARKPTVRLHAAIDDYISL